MKNLVFKIYKSTKEEMEGSVKKNGGQPWMYALRLDYWLDEYSGAAGKPDGCLTMCRQTPLGAILDAIKEKERML
jgi:hypothetical protein